MGLVAADEVGYRNLMALSTIGYTEGFYYRPRIDDEAIARHAQGLIGFSGCMSGKIPMLLQQDRMQEAEELAGRTSGCSSWPGARGCRWSRPTTSTTAAATTPMRRTC